MSRAVDFYQQVIGFENIVSFDKTREWGQAPSRLSGAEVKNQFSNVLKIEDLKRGEKRRMNKMKEMIRLLGRRKAFFMN